MLAIFFYKNFKRSKNSVCDGECEQLTKNEGTDKYFVQSRSYKGWSYACHVRSLNDIVWAIGRQMLTKWSGFGRERSKVKLSNKPENVSWFDSTMQRNLLQQFSQDVLKNNITK